MVFPNFKNKHAHDAMFSPEDSLNYQRKMDGSKVYTPPENIVICYSQQLLNYVKKRYGIIREKWAFAELYILKDAKSPVGILGNFGFGAPVVVTLAEGLIARGAKRFISVGLAGGLQKNLDFGDIIVCDRAIRDEGTSFHYLEPSRYAYPSGNMTDSIMQELDKRKIAYTKGASWTIDAPYRETVAEARQYQNEGVLTVEMEASALFALAEYRGVQMGAIFTISDSLAELEWSPEFYSEKTTKGLRTICRAALEMLAEYP